MNKISITRFGQDQLKKKRSKWVKPLILGLLFFAVIVLATVKVEELIRTNVVRLSVDNDANAAWIGSLASYWGGVLGGIISGVIAIVGVFYTIQFTREADRNKERQSIQPFLNIEITKKPSHGTVRQFTIANNSELLEDKAGQSFCPIYLSITNIGNGFANTMTFGTGDNVSGLDYREVFTVNETKVVLLRVAPNRMRSGVKFFVDFADSMTNEYIQRYELKNDLTGYGYDIDIGYPYLVQ